MTIVVRNPRAVEIAARLAEARGIGEEQLVEELLEREWRARALGSADVEAIARAFRERNGIAQGSGDPRPSSEIIDEAWGER
jgi:hypothetical protein